MSAVQPTTLLHPLDLGFNSTGILNPSTRDMPNISKFLPWFNENSTKVLGGEPENWHSSLPPQSPVSQIPCPVLSNLQLVLPQILPVVGEGNFKSQVWFVSRRRPPPG
ncbi:hypothetical protein IC582_019039 [Cucumis melo]